MKIKNHLLSSVLFLILGSVNMPPVFSMVEDADPKKSLEANSSETTTERTAEVGNTATKEAADATTSVPGIMTDNDSGSSAGEDPIRLASPDAIDSSQAALDQKKAEAEQESVTWQQEHKKIATLTYIPPDEFECLNQDSLNAAAYWRQEQEIYSNLVEALKLDKKQGPQRRAIRRVIDACEEAAEAAEQVQEHLSQQATIRVHAEPIPVIEGTPLKGRLAQGWNSDIVQAREDEHAQLKNKRDEIKGKDSPRWKALERERVNAYQRARYARKKIQESNLEQVDRRRSSGSTDEEISLSDFINGEDSAFQLVELDKATQKEVYRAVHKVISGAHYNPKTAVRKIKTTTSASDETKTATASQPISSETASLLAKEAPHSTAAVVHKAMAFDSDALLDSYLFEKERDIINTALSAEQAAKAANENASSTGKLKMHLWSEAVKKAEAAYQAYNDYINKALSSSETSEDRQELGSKLEAAKNRQALWHTHKDWYKAEERTAAANAARKTAEGATEIQKSLKKTSIRCTQEAAAAWRQAINSFEEGFAQLANYNWRAPLEIWHQHESYWNELVAADQITHKDLIASIEHSKAAATAAATASDTEISSHAAVPPLSQPTLRNQKLSPDNGLSEEEEIKYEGKSHLIACQDVKMNEPNRTKRVRILQIPGAYRYLRTEEVFNPENKHVISRNQMLADQLIITPGPNFNEASFMKSMKLEVTAIRKETLFKEDLYILQLARYYKDSLEESLLNALSDAESKLQELGGEMVRNYKPSFFLTKAGNCNTSDSKTNPFSEKAKQKSSTHSSRQEDTPPSESQQNEVTPSLSSETDHVDAEHVRETRNAVVPIIQDISAEQSISEITNQAVNKALSNTLKIHQDKVLGDLLRDSLMQLSAPEDLPAPEDTDPIIAICDSGIAQNHPFFIQRQIRIFNTYFTPGPIISLMQNHLQDYLRDFLFHLLNTYSLGQKDKFRIADKSTELIFKEVHNAATKHITDLVTAYNNTDTEQKQNPSFQKIREKLYQSDHKDLESRLRLITSNLELQSKLNSLFQQQPPCETAAPSSFLSINISNAIAGLITDLIYHHDLDTITTRLGSNLEPESQEAEHACREYLTQQFDNALTNDVVKDYLLKDKCDHGTGTTGVVTRFIGNAARLLICKDSDGIGATPIDAALCIAHAYEQGAATFNYSADIFLSKRECNPDGNESTREYIDSHVNNALKQIGPPTEESHQEREPMAVVLAAGNNGKELPKIEDNLDHVLFVAATNENHDDLLGHSTTTRNEAPSSYDFITKQNAASRYGNHLVRLAARGEGIATTSAARFNTPNGVEYVSLYRRVSGTSFAAPRVAAALAILKKERPSSNPEELIEGLFEDHTEEVDSLRDRIQNGKKLIFGDN